MRAFKAVSYYTLNGFFGKGQDMLYAGIASAYKEHQYKKGLSIEKWKGNLLKN